MWPRKNVDLYVHIEYELPDRFYAPTTMGPYQCICRKLSIQELIEYVNKLTTFPNIMARVFMPDAWLLFKFKDYEQFEDFCDQIEE